MFLTSTDLGDDPLCQSDVLRQLLSETLTHVVIDVVGAEQLLEGLEGVGKREGKKSHTNQKTSECQPTACVCSTLVVSPMFWVRMWHTLWPSLILCLRWDSSRA